MHTFKIAMTLLAATMLVACGGGKKGGSDKTSYEQLESLEAELVSAMDKVTGPIDQVDTMITRFTDLPNKFKLSPDDFKACAGSIFAGQAAVPGGVDAKTATELKGFAKDFGGFKTSLMNSPDNVKALVGEVAGALVSIPLLAG